MGNIIKKVRKNKRHPEESIKYRVIVANCSVTEPISDNSHPNHGYSNNRIVTTKYTALSFFPKNLFEQFHRFANLYFLFIVLLNFIPEVNAVGKEVAAMPVIFVLAVTAFKDAFEDYRRFKSDRQINHLKSRVYDRSCKQYVLTDWETVHVGDIVHLSCNEVIPADILLLHSSDDHGLCYIETSNLDGENNLKQRDTVVGLSENEQSLVPDEFHHTIECDLPRPEINRFHGSVLTALTKHYKENGVSTRIHGNSKRLPSHAIPYDSIVSVRDFLHNHVDECGILLPGRIPGYKSSDIKLLPSSESKSSVYRRLQENGQRVSINKHNLLLRGCVLRNTDFVEGIVVYAGHESKAMLNNRGPRYKRSRLEKNMNRDVLMCVLVLTGMCLFSAVGSGLWLGQFDEKSNIQFLPRDSSDDREPVLQAFIVFWTYLILYQVVIPISLYVSIEIVKLGQVYFITQDKEMYHEETDSSAECRALNITEDLGQVEYIFSDKTGTLTENKMEFRSCTIGGINYPHLLGPLLDESMDAADHDTSIRSSRSSVWTFTPEPMLMSDMSVMSVGTMSGQDKTIPLQKRQIHEFFLVLAICNTVMVTKHGHYDQMNDELENTSFPENNPVDTQQTDQSSYHPVSHDHESSQNKTSAEERSHPVRRKSFLKHKRTASNISNTSTGPPVKTPRSAFHKAQRVLLGKKSVSPTKTSTSDAASLDVEESNTVTVSGTTQMFEAVYEAESPDELALVRAAAKYGCRLLHRSSHKVTVWLPGEGQVTYQILHILYFDAFRKRMSVIVRCPLTGDIVLYCKGADSTILSNLSQQGHQRSEKDHFKQSTKMVQKTKEHLTNYAKNGLRTLCMAKRVISPEEYKSWLRLHQEAETSMTNRDQLLLESMDNIEMQLELLGATGVEDRLQDGAAETIRDLQRAGIAVWVLTGDKEETAVNVAYSCGLISFDQELLNITSNSRDSAESLLSLSMTSVKQRSLQNQSQQVNSTISEGETWLPPANTAMLIDGKALASALDKRNIKMFINLVQHCTSVICCRTTPSQKAAVVKLVRDKLNKHTLSIGDGANDVSMIQTADIGVGISGQEGMQAVMAADFAIARFRFLKRLLLVHGHWSYYRLAIMTLYMFYKNTVFVMMVLWYQLFNGFSGSYMMDQINLLIFNFYTALPPLMTGIFDQSVRDSVLMAKPKLYRESQNSVMYQRYSYWMNILDAFYQSMVMYFIPHFAYWDKNVGMLEFGTVCNIGAVTTCLMHLGIESRSIMWPHWFCGILSAASVWIFCVIFNFFCVTCLHPDSPYMVIQHAIVKPQFWLVILLVICVALLPRYIIRSIQWTFYPTLTQTAMQDHKDREQAASTISSYVTWSSVSSKADSLELSSSHQDDDPSSRSTINVISNSVSSPSGTQSQLHNFQSEPRTNEETIVVHL